MTTRLCVLGSSGGFPEYGIPCSGYLLRNDAGSILIDCGPGVAGALFRGAATPMLDSILISHLHPDHVLDLMPVAYGLLSQWIAGRRMAPLPLYLPQGGEAFLRSYSDLFGHRNWHFPDAWQFAGQAALKKRLDQKQDWVLSIFDVREYQAGQVWEIPGAKVLTQAVSHSVPTSAFRVELPQCTVVYTADTGWNNELPGFAKYADLLLADAHHSSARAPGGVHMTPQEAGRLASLAKASTLVLCHLATADDAESAVEAASAEFDGDVRVAVRDREYLL